MVDTEIPALITPERPFTGRLKTRFCSHGVNLQTLPIHNILWLPRLT